MPPYRQRRSPRLQGYNYSQSGAYFVTICTHNRSPIFGTIIDGCMQLSEAGLIAAQRWETIPEHHPSVELDVFVVMPNHVHGILILAEAVPGLTQERTGSISAVMLGTVIGSYKSSVTRHIHNMNLMSDSPVWQGRYHDHVIRSESDLNRIRAYVELNPQRWIDDQFYQ
jgi:putative transposase